MRLAILVLVLLLVFVTLNYILKCLEYKDLRDLFDNRGESIKMLNEEVERKSELAKELFGNRDELIHLLYNNGAEVERLRHKVYVLRKDIKRKDRAIVRYKTQNEVFKHGYHAAEERNKKLRKMYTTEIETEQWLRGMWYATSDERDAYLYCLRQIQEEVEHAKKK